MDDVLGQLGIDTGDGILVEVHNKIDKLESDERAMASGLAERRNDAIAISALTGEGIDALLRRLDVAFGSRRRIVEFEVDLADGARLAWLYRYGEVLSRKDDGLRTRSSAWVSTRPISDAWSGSAAAGADPKNFFCRSR